jgi:hypothetical protein
MTMSDPTNCDDVIDSRDVIARIEELESERNDLEAAAQEADDALENATEGVNRSYLESAQLTAALALRDWDVDNGEELKALQGLESQAEGYCDWRHGATLIRDNYFESYAQEQAEDLHGDKVRHAQWPFNCIDWEQAANELQQDYTAVEFDGVTYWVQ